MALTKKDTENLSPPERTSVALSQLRSQVNAKGAHFFRTSYRRLQTWLRTFDGLSPDKRQKRAMKYLNKVLRACGKLRDTELHRKILKSIEVNGDPTARAAIERILRKRRDKRRDAVTASRVLGISTTNCTTRLNRALKKLEEALNVAA